MISFNDNKLKEITNNITRWFTPPLICSTKLGLLSLSHSPFLVLLMTSSWLEVGFSFLSVVPPMNSHLFL